MSTRKIWDSEHFDICNSSIVSSGKGLFSKENIQPGDTIGHYTGIVVSDKEVERAPYVDSHYILWVCKDCNIVGEGPLANHTRYINHHKKPNAHFVISTRWKKARIEAITTILPGQEVFIDYGPDFWEFFTEQKLA